MRSFQRLTPQGKAILKKEADTGEYRFRPSSIPRRASLQGRTTAAKTPDLIEEDTEDIPAVVQKKKHHPSYRQRPMAKREGNTILSAFVGVCLVLAIVFVVQIIIPFCTNKLNDFKYGNPRTATYDVNVSHGTLQQPLSHFIALNMQGQAQVIECPAENCEHAIIYTAQNLYDSGIPVTLEFKDLANNGKLDLVIIMEGKADVIMNNGKQFDRKIPIPVNAKLNL